LAADLVCEVFFFFVATLIAGSTWCPMRAIAPPSAGVADACEAKVNETADAATRANKVLFICFLLHVLGASNTGRARFGAGRPASRYSLKLRAMTGGGRLDFKSAPLSRAVRARHFQFTLTTFRIYVLSTTENSSPNKYA
jgi:hypothetical protein